MLAFRLTVLNTGVSGFDDACMDTGATVSDSGLGTIWIVGSTGDDLVNCRVLALSKENAASSKVFC